MFADQPSMPPMAPGAYLTRRISPLLIILPILFVVFTAALGLVIFVIYRSNKQKRATVQPSEISAQNLPDCQKGGQVNTVSAGLNSYSQTSMGAKQNGVDTMEPGIQPPVLNESGDMSGSMASYLIKSGSTATRAKKYNTVRVDLPLPDSHQKEARPDSSFKSKSFSNFAAKNEPRDPNHIYENDYDN